MIYWYILGEEWRVWTREQATQCLRSGLEKVTRSRKGMAKGTAADIRPEEFALYSGRIGSVITLAARVIRTIGNST